MTKSKLQNFLFNTVISAFAILAIQSPANSFAVESSLDSQGIIVAEAQNNLEPCTDEVLKERLKELRQLRARLAELEAGAEPIYLFEIFDLRLMIKDYLRALVVECGEHSV